MSVFNLFWTIFGDMDIDSLFLPANLWMTYETGLLLYAVYVVMVVIIMLNALIAMLSNTYSRVEVEDEYSFFRRRCFIR